MKPIKIDEADLAKVSLPARERGLKLLNRFSKNPCKIEINVNNDIIMIASNLRPRIVQYLQAFFTVTVIGVHKRVLISRTGEHIESDGNISTNIRHFIYYLSQA